MADKIKKAIKIAVVVFLVAYGFRDFGFVKNATSFFSLKGFK